MNELTNLLTVHKTSMYSCIHVCIFLFMSHAHKGRTVYVCTYIIMCKHGYMYIYVYVWCVLVRVSVASLDQENSSHSQQTVPVDVISPSHDPHLDTTGTATS